MKFELGQEVVIARKVEQDKGAECWWDTTGTMDKSLGEKGIILKVNNKDYFVVTIVGKWYYLEACLDSVKEI